MGIHTSLQGNAFFSSGYVLRNGIDGSYGSSIFNFLKNLYAVFQSDCTSDCFTFPKTMCRGSLFSLLLPAFVTSCLFDNNYPDICEVIIVVLLAFP